MRDKQSSVKNEFSSECSRGHVESSLDFPFGILSSYIRELCPKFPKKLEELNFYQLSPEDSSGHKKTSSKALMNVFGQKLEKFWSDFRKL